ncbi:MAG: alpha/beta hydrolase fold domain-containing protein [Phycisphaerae bacterium]|nr:alpha/beta hydrolase fold domain-containing protein [Phycisphaerae bacterium]
MHGIHLTAGLIVVVVMTANMSCRVPADRSRGTWTRVPAVAAHPVRYLSAPRVDRPTYSYWPGGPDVAVYVHGGGWVEGTRYDLPGWTVAFEDAGWTVASVDYSLADRAYPRSVSEVMEAVERVRTELNARRLVLAGYSAGSFLALEAVERGTEVDGLVLASVPFTPGRDAAAMPEDMAEKTRDTIERAFGSDVPSAECQAGHKPMYVIYGRQDVITSWTINEESLAQCGRTGPTFVDLAEGGHDPSACVNMEALRDFLTGL